MKDKTKEQKDAKKKVEELAEQDQDWNNAPGKEKAPQPTPYKPK